MVDVRFELTTNNPWSVDDAICDGISLLGYWQKVNQSPSTQTKSLITLSPPLNSGILGRRMGPYVPSLKFFYNLWGPRESDLSVRWATAKRLTSRLPKLSLITPPLKQAGVNKTIVETWNSAATGSIRRTALTGCGSLVCVGFAISLWRQLNYV